MENFDSEPTPLQDPYNCFLTLEAPRSKGALLQKILFPFVGWIDPSFRIVRVAEKQDVHFHSRLCATRTKTGVKTDAGTLKCPALCVMLFVQESGMLCVKDVERLFQKQPWKFHHKVELQSRRTPNCPVAKQEFYKLGNDQPLWAVCPVHYGNEHFRFNLYVTNFKAMVEFYRLMTNVEIETNKPGFCIFQLYSQPGLDIQISLKRSPYIEPVPLDTAYLCFNISCLDSIEPGLKSEVTSLGDSTYAVRDPDGNLVVLHEITPRGSAETSPQGSMCCSKSDISEDMKSFHSNADSHDSGRCSDIDPSNSENEQHCKQQTRSDSEGEYTCSSESATDVKIKVQTHRNSTREAGPESCRGRPKTMKSIKAVYV